MPNPDPTQTPAPKKTRQDNNHQNAPHRKGKRTWKDSEQQQLVTRTIQNNLAHLENRTSTIILSGLKGNDEKDLNQPQVNICVQACKANKLFDLQFLVRHMWQNDVIINEVANLLMNPNSNADLDKVFIVQSINKKVVESFFECYEKEVSLGKCTLEIEMEDDEKAEEKKALVVFEKIKQMKEKLNKKLSCYSAQVGLILVLDDDMEQYERACWYKINANKFDIHDTMMPANIPVVTNEEPEKINEKKLTIKLKNLAKTISHSVNSRNFEKRQQKTAVKVSFIR